MKESLSPHYNPGEHENYIYRLWEKSGFFNPDALPGRRRKPFAIMMAPPNITGHIHIGHALENTLSDILIRKRRMEGFKTLFVPGKDHAGIAAQYVVERELKKEGKTRRDLGKEKFLERMWQWMKENGDAIENEFKALGISCDWTRKRFTLDLPYQRAVRAAFEHYHKKGWIYRGKRMVNWCSRCSTSISDLEVTYREEQGTLWFIRYPFTDGSGAITVATTRPETMLGDAAVAVHPQDARYKNMVGKTVILPIQNREIPVIADAAIDPSFGTGAVKVTPAHDALDFEIAERHNLPYYTLINQEGRMTKEAGSVCAGTKTLECREIIIRALEELGAIDHKEAYPHRVAQCDRCGTVIEPMLSEQWFLSMRELGKLAASAVRKNKIRFVPPQRKKIFLEWLKGVKDWNISRQLWWGHRLPVFCCSKKWEECKMQNANCEINETDFIVAQKPPAQCPSCKQCTPREADDVLDTWFSSALWPFAALGWPEKTRDFKTFYPTTLISSAREIFFLWIVRMVFSGLELTGRQPFNTVYIHATVLDPKGRKMSKSLGNVVDPITMIEKYGTDALRFGLVWQVLGTQDLHWNEGALLAGKKFANKIWNAARFVLAQLAPVRYKLSTAVKPKTAADKKILAALKKTAKNVTTHIDRYEFGKALHALYEFFWHEFCDVYIEASKTQLNDPAMKKNTAALLLWVLSRSLRLLHPFMPFITEAIWEKLPIKNKKLLIVEGWPRYNQ